MLHRWRFVIAGIMIILVNQLVTFAVSAKMRGALLPAGSSRYAAAYSDSSYTVAATGNWETLQGMTKYITIPSGQTADVMVYFCAEISGSAADYYYIRGLLRTDPGNPPSVQRVPADIPSNQCAVFHWTNVSAGQPPIKVQLFVLPMDFINIGRASMTVTVNLH